MADSNYKGKAARSANGFWNTVVLPAVFGALGASLLMQVIPEMFALTNDGTPVADAFPQAVVIVFDELRGALVYGGSHDPLGWPLFGMVAGVFLFKLFNLSER